MIIIGTFGRHHHPSLDGVELALQRIPSFELSARRAAKTAPGKRWCFTVPYLSFHDFEKDKRTILRLERHTKPLGLTRGAARIVVPENAEASYLIELAQLQPRLGLVFEAPEQLEAALRQAGVRTTAHTPSELKYGGYGLVDSESIAWLHAARTLSDDVYLMAANPIALKLKRLLNDQDEALVEKTSS